MLRVLLLALICSAASASAQLQWEKTWQEFHRAPDDEKIEAAFAFKNAGATPVKIKSVRSSCGCTTARLEKKIYEAGESGALTASFKFGGRKGPQRKLITVTTEDGAKHELNLMVFIHPVLNVTPALVFWCVGQPAEERTVQLSAEPGTRVNVKSVRSSNPKVRATLKTVKAGEQFVLTVTPSDTTQRETAELLVQTDYPPDAPKTFTIHARIK